MKGQAFWSTELQSKVSGGKNMNTRHVRLVVVSLVLGIVALFGGAPNIAHAGNCVNDANQIVIYEHPNYQGTCETLGVGDYGNPRAMGFPNDATSSIKVGGNVKAQLCEHDGFNGTCEWFTGDDSDFANNAIGHDRASSVKVQTKSAGSANCDGGEGVYIYEHPSYQGRCSKFTSDSPNPTAWYIGNDAASSIRFAGSWTAILYEHDNNQGVSSTFRSDDPDFGNDNIGHDRASSIRVQRGGGNTCANIPSGQYCVEYYNSRNLSGSPILSRNEGSINYDWGTASPGNGVNNDNFSARWRGRFNFDSGNYVFSATADDGIRVYVDGNPVIDAWRDQGTTTYRQSRNLSTGDHEIKVEYYENGGGAVAQFRWEKNVVNSCANIPAGQYCAEYYNSRDLSGAPVLVRNEGNINYDWGNSSPGSGVNNDNFSTRWRGRFNFDSANYAIIARVDDGIRVFIDGNPVIDAWQDQAATEYRQTRTISAGEHEVKVEYCENGGGAVAQVRWEKTAPPDNGLRGKKVTLDPGHGWQGDPGATANGMQEKSVVLDIANRTKVNLESYGIQVSMTRTGDEPSLGLSYAAIRATQFNAELVVAIHANAGGGTGTESCYVINKPTSVQSQRFVTLLTQQVSSQMGLDKRGDFPENAGDRCARRNSTGWNQLYIHDMNPVTALIETAFIDGPSNNDVAKLRERRGDFAKAISDAIVQYLKSQ